MFKEQITLIGRGWLGCPLAENLISLGYNLLSTSTTPQKKCYLFDITKDKVPHEFLKRDILIYTIPPLPSDVVISFFSHFPRDQKIIFISSSSVYGKNQGLINEESKRIPESENGKRLVEIENYICLHFKAACILRPSGLYGKKRHPIYSLQNRPPLKNGNEFTLLAHLDDCINAITAIIEKKYWGQHFNIVSDLKMKKSVYYPLIAEKLALQPPLYENIDIATPTEISNHKSKEILEIRYLNPLDYECV